MVRTYTWNPSTQSSLKIIGNLNNEDEKTVTGFFPTASTTNLYSTQCFSNSPICKPNYKNDQVTNISTTVPKDGTQNDTTGSSSKVLSAGNSHIQFPIHMLHSQRAPSWQPHHQFFPIYYPISFDFPTNPYQRRSHLFPSQITTPIMLDQETNLRPVDLWHLRPIQIGNKVYYEPVSSNSALYSSSPASTVPHMVTSDNLVSIPNNAQFRNDNLSHLPSVTTIPLPVENITGQNKFPHSEAVGINHSMTSSNNLPWTFGAPQPNSEIRETPSWQTPLSVTRESLIFDRETNKNATVSSFQNLQRQVPTNHQLHGSSYQHSLSHTTTPSLQNQCYRKVTATDSTEQYKRDLQLQIEQNRHRREEERQRELERERKEIIKFEEYRRKAQQEIEEEERKEKEKILAAQRRAVRMRALQEEAALKAGHEAKNCTKRNICCSSVDTKRLEKRTSSTAELNHLEWWEKKKEHVNDNAQRSAHSPVIPTLRKKNGTSVDFSRNAHFEISANNANASSYVPFDRFNKSRSLSRLGRRCYHSSLTSGRNNSLDSVRLRRKSTHAHQRNESPLNSLQNRHLGTGEAFQSVD